MASNSDDLELTTWMTFNWRANPVLGNTFQIVIDEIQKVMEDAQEQARENVAIGHGPSSHGTPQEQSGVHYESRMFFYEDTGNLAAAIQIETSYSRNANGKWEGAPQARLVVRPITVVDDQGNSRVVNYGAYLELGFRPVIPGSSGATFGVFRYPFLAPAMYMATRNIVNRTGLRLSQELADMERRAKGQKARIHEVPITEHTANRIWKGVEEEVRVQNVQDLDNRKGSNDPIPGYPIPPAPQRRRQVLSILERRRRDLERRLGAAKQTKTQERLQRKLDRLGGARPQQVAPAKSDPKPKPPPRQADPDAHLYRASRRQMQDVIKRIRNTDPDDKQTRAELIQQLNAMQASRDLIAQRREKRKRDEEKK